MIRLPEGFDYYVLNCEDIHGSEYVGGHDRCVAYFSHFSGEAAVLVIGRKESCLWVDGRYFIQAEKELKGTGIKLMKMGEKGVPTVWEYLEKNVGRDDFLGWYSPLADTELASEFDEKLMALPCHKTWNYDLAQELWADRPERACNKIWIHDEKFAGESAADKLKRVRREMKKQKADVLLVKALDDIAWLTNLRGSDIECNPVFLSFMYIDKCEAVLFVQQQAVSKKVRKYLKDNGFDIADYDDYFDFLKFIRRKNAKTDIIARIKCVKSKEELRHIRECHVRDGAYVTKMIYRLKKWSESANREKLTEIGVADELYVLRSRDKNFVSLSFPTIAAYGSNGAIVHYTADEESNTEIKPEGFLLIDSGAQYLDGTTDITRTVAMGPLTDEMKRDYTLTVIGMLRLMNARFPEKASHVGLDSIARGPLWDYGMDFNHGTGHGVGYLGNVHEGPVTIRMKERIGDVRFAPGMICSDEPGVYIEGKYGIRTENMIECIADTQKGFLRFESLTWAPLDPDAISTKYMNDTDVELYNRYQTKVYEKIGMLLNRREREWLYEVTREI